MRGHTIALDCLPLTAELLADQDCVLVVTNHDDYDWDFIVRHSGLLVETRGATRQVARSGGPQIVYA